MTESLLLMSYAPGQLYDVMESSVEPADRVQSEAAPALSNTDDSSFLRSFLQEMGMLSSNYPTRTLVQRVNLSVVALIVNRNLFVITLLFSFEKSCD